MRDVQGRETLTQWADRRTSYQAKTGIPPPPPPPVYVRAKSGNQQCDGVAVFGQGRSCARPMIQQRRA